MLLLYIQRCKIAFLIATSLLTACFPLRVIFYQTASIDDYKIFANDTLKTNKKLNYPLSIFYNQLLPDSFENYLLSIKTTAFLVIKNDSILIERYYNKYDKNTLSNSFSIAKSIISILLSQAITDGYIKSLNDYVTDYLPESQNLKNIRIIDLLTMSSQITSKENYYNPFNLIAKAYYGRNLKNIIKKIKIDTTKKNFFEYNSLNTQVLSLIIEKTTGRRISEYATQKLWSPLQMENIALWSLDKTNGEAKAYCCLHATARDFAKIGSLIIHNGKWRNALIPSWYINEIFKPATYLKDKYNRPVTYYSLHWWLLKYNNYNVLLACGLYGQYIGIIPNKNIVFVRLGFKNSKDKMYPFYKEIYEIVKFVDTL